MRQASILLRLGPFHKMFDVFAQAVAKGVMSVMVSDGLNLSIGKGLDFNALDAFLLDRCP